MRSTDILHHTLHHNKSIVFSIKFRFDTAWSSNLKYKLILLKSLAPCLRSSCESRFNLVLFTIHDWDFSCFTAVKNRGDWLKQKDKKNPRQ